MSSTTTTTSRSCVVSCRVICRKSVRSRTATQPQQQDGWEETGVAHARVQAASIEELVHPEEHRDGALVDLVDVSRAAGTDSGIDFGHGFFDSEFSYGYESGEFRLQTHWRFCRSSLLCSRQRSAWVASGYVKARVAMDRSYTRGQQQFKPRNNISVNARTVSSSRTPSLRPCQ